MEKPISECCQAAIVQNPDPWVSDKCSLCGREVRYALMCLEWAAFEPCGVFKNFADEMMFFWQQMSKWSVVEEVIDSQEYLGQVKELVETPSRLYRMDLDCIPVELCVEFLENYKTQVKNHEICDLYTGYGGK